MANELTNSQNYNRELRNRLNNWFSGDNLLDFPKDIFDAHAMTSFMQSDVVESDKNYTIAIDMPGMNKEKIHLNYKNGVLTVSGTRETFTDLSDHDGNILHNERSVGHVSRQYHLPDVDEKNTHAKYEGGVLKVTLPKKEEDPENPSNITIE